MGFSKFRYECRYLFLRSIEKTYIAHYKYSSPPEAALIVDKDASYYPGTEKEFLLDEKNNYVSATVLGTRFEAST